MLLRLLTEEPLVRLTAQSSADEPVVRLTAQSRILAAVIAVVFMAMILELIRRHRLQERYSVIWFFAGAAMLIGAIFPDLLTVLANALGVRDVTIALFSLILLVLLGLALNFSVIVSRQGEQITRLAQERALEGAGEDGNRSSADRETLRKPEEERLQG